MIGSKEMCNLKEEFEEPNTVRECKRKRFRCDFGEIYRPPKRLSPFLNTPKEKKEERRRILKISIKKLKEIENAELCLRRSLLIQNTVRRLQKELRLDKQTKGWRNSVKTARMGCRCNTSVCYMKNSLLYDDPVITDLNENISDDMTDTLMKNLEEKIGGRLGCATSGDGGASNPRICVTPTPNIYESTAGPRTCVTPVPVERNDHINIHLHCENDASVISVSDSEKCLDCSVLIAENSKRNHFEYEKMQTYFETGNEHTEIDVTTHNTFAHKIPLGVEMDTNRTKLSNFISLSKDNSNDIINLPHSFPMDVTSLPSFVNIDHSQNLPHGFPMDITSLPSVMNIEHSQNDDNLDPKSPCNHTVIEPDRHCRDQSKEDIGNGVVMNFPITEKTLCFNNLSDTKEDNATEETVKNSLKIHSSLVNG